MPTSPPRAGNWTHADGVALKDYMERCFESQRIYCDVRITAVEKAIEQADKVLEERLMAINVRSDVNAKAIDDLKTFRDRLDGKASQQSVILATILGLAGLIFAVVDLLMKLWV